MVIFGICVCEYAILVLQTAISTDRRVCNRCERTLRPKFCAKWPCDACKTEKVLVASPTKGYNINGPDTEDALSTDCVFATDDLNIVLVVRGDRASGILRTICLLLFVDSTV